MLAGYNPPVVKAIDATPPDVRAAARRHLADVLPLDLAAVEDAVSDLRRDAYLGGIVIASKAVNGDLPGFMGDASAWDAWTPGWAGAAAAISDTGLSAVLANVGLTVKGMADTTIDQMGTQLADGVASGASMDSIAGSLLAFVGGDRDRAYMIADTEAARAVGTATLDTYQANNVPGKEWLLAEDPCDVCQENGDAGVIPVDETFPSGDDAPPAHPRCRCSLSPASLDASSDLEATAAGDTADETDQEG